MTNTNRRKSVTSPKRATKPARQSVLTSPYKNIKSKVFNVSRLVNPLVATASPLLTLASQLRLLDTAPNFTKLQKQLVHEVRAFESKAQRLGYKTDTVLIARYLLCSLIDETLHFQYSQFSEQKETHLLTVFHNEDSGDHNAITLIEKTIEHSQFHIDLIELSYLCLSLGLQGRFRTLKDGHNQLNIFTDKLYQLIQHSRGDATQQLLLTAPNNECIKKASRWRLPATWITLSVAVFVLGGIYLPYRTHLDHLSHSVEKQLLLQTTQHGKQPTSPTKTTNR